ncbi:LysR family transcriptional regulator [Kordiimonas sp. SCSIO 12603]|uniref:LysR substrate-binding domain-containing protein n=1 Tax=Kordiimonas sp. SCSIO 12603 TaxID=2829596 RepID=UPI0021062E22|nr:LysR substrate-binding domain-containing protein [Kordiimonas sp. SCSIO 12603]UTW60158.1 LysR family transcriptional regulator [Kordiimonas sp. SCSIO 12603]
MVFKLRSLSGLMAFDAAARHGSLTLAAKELGRTQSAVSQQVKLLEEETGLKLFVRKPREVALTPEGRALADSVREAFEGIEETINQQSKRDEPNVLRLTTYQSFAINWLIPRLSKFNARHPEIDVILNVDDRPQDIRAEGYDIAVRVGRYSNVLLKEMFAPIYAPSLSEGKDITKEIAHSFSLLEHQTKDAWASWFDLNGVDITKVKIAGRYSHSGLLIQAAAAGAGIALVPYAIASNAIFAGQFKCVRGKPLDTPYGYYIVHAQEDKPEKARLFESWLMEEFAEMERQMAPYIQVTE